MNVNIPTSMMTNQYELELISSDPKRTSEVWRYVGYLKAIGPERIENAIKEIRFCNICFAQCDYLKFVNRFSKGTSTDPIRLHLLNKHNINLPSLQLNQIAANSSAKVFIDILVKIILDDDSFNLVNKKGMNHLLQYFPIKKFPSNTYLSNNLLPLLYDFFANYIIDFISQNCIFSCLQVDMWSDFCFKNQYVAFNLFFMNEELKLFKVLLDLNPFSPPHSSANINLKNNEQLNRFNLDKNKIFLMIDNGANILNCARENGFEFDTCLAHNAHLLLMNDGIGKCEENGHYLQNLLRRLKKLYNYYKFKKHLLSELRHDVVAEVLESNYDHMTLDERYPAISVVHVLPPDRSEDQIIRELENVQQILNHIPSRWGTLSRSLKSVSANYVLINAANWVLSLDACYSISSYDLDLINELIKHLDIFHVNTVALGSETVPVISDIVLAYLEIKNFYAEDKDRSFKEEIVEFRKLIRLKFNDRFQLNNFHKLGGLLDPNLKNNRIVTDLLNGQTAEDFLAYNLNKYVFNPSNDLPTNDQQPLMRATRSTTRNRSLSITRNRSLSTTRNRSLPNSRSNSNLTTSPTIARRSNHQSIPSNLNLATPENNTLSQRLARIQRIEIDTYGEVNQVNLEINREVQAYLNSNQENEDSLIYWRRNRFAFPNLYRLYRVVGAIQVENTATERTFAHIALKETKRNTKLINNKMQKLAFIKENFKILEKVIKENFNPSLDENNN